jgi:hypothetical protein
MDFNYLMEDIERTLRDLEEDAQLFVAAASIREGRL